MNPYQEKCVIRKANPQTGLEVDQFDWCWIRTDSGGFEIPRHDWHTEHSVKWFQHVKRYGVAVQAGGSCGMYPRMLATRFQVVYTFEPSPLSFYCLTNNCQSDNIVKVQAALGACADSVCLQICENNVGMNRIKSGNGFVPQLTLDSFDLPACDLLAFDMEDSEIWALQGARETIEKYKPVITCENGHTADIKAFMAELGYVYADKSGMDIIYVKS